MKSMKVWRKVSRCGSAARKVRRWWTGCTRRLGPFTWYTGYVKRDGGDAYLTTALFVLPQVSKDRVVIGGASFDPHYLKQTFFPEMLDELIAQNLTDEKAGTTGDDGLSSGRRRGV